jgi:hypothetical protein
LRKDSDTDKMGTRRHSSRLYRVGLRLEMAIPEPSRQDLRRAGHGTGVVEARFITRTADGSDSALMENVNMRRASLSAAFACALVAALFYLARARDAREGAVNAAPSWEYRVLMLTEVVSLQQAIHEPAKAGAAVESKFNELGRDGWELCEHINGMVVFKRQRP